MSADPWFVVTSACTACGACLRTCHLRCLRINPPGISPPVRILDDVCDGCGECAEVCPAEAIYPIQEVLRATHGT
ncbi:4Fe-4S binding protein [Haloglycomyces albus]|uniref:4Fe-4S binding protein n=1 Tax=Haloglycomyces albus TaxID=526067 RepID=UPI00046D81C0|nr:4Fe-4S binding protein [Haloglycomyces albus]